MAPPPRRRSKPAGGGEPPDKENPAAPDYVPPEPGKVDAVELLGSLDSVDRAIVKIKYENRGLSYSQIGKLLEPPISKQAVERRINDHGLKPVLAALEGDVVAAFKSHQSTAVGVIAQTMAGTNKSWLRYQAAIFFLQSLSTSKLSEPDVPEVTELIVYDPNAPKAKK